MSSTTPGEMDPVESELQRIIATDREFVEQADILTAMANELASRKSELHSNTISNRSAEDIEQALDELEIQLGYQFEKVLDLVATKCGDKEVLIKTIAKLLFDIEKIRYSAVGKLVPDCPHCETGKLSVAEYTEILEEDLEAVFVISKDDEEYLAARKAMISLFMERAEQYIEVTKIHLPYEYHGSDLRDIAVKVGEFALKIGLTATGTIIGLSIYDAIKR